MIKEDEKQLDLMWQFLDSGMVKSNVDVLKEYCEMLRHAMKQKTTGQSPYAKRGDIDWKNLGTIINTIVIEAMCLYLSGDLDRIKEAEDEEHTD